MISSNSPWFLNIQLIIPPPRSTSQLSIIVKVKDLYAIIYQQRFKIEKKDRYGLHAEIEGRTLYLLEKGIKASLQTGSNQKQTIIKEMRVTIEVLKHLVRLEYDTKLISSKKYFNIEEKLIELSKMSLGWERHTKQKYHT